MLHINHTPQKKHLFGMLKNIATAPTENMLYYFKGGFHGFTCAQFPMVYNSLELQRLDNLADELFAKRKGELK